MQLPLAESCQAKGIVVRIPLGLHERILAEFAIYGQEKEIAWGIFGRNLEGVLLPFAAVRCEKSSELDRVAFDHNKLSDVCFRLAEVFGDIDFLGHVHSHPHGQGFPSTNLPGPSDLAADLAWLEANKVPVGLFGIACKNAKAELHWYTLEMGATAYAFAAVEFADGVDWLSWQKESER